MFVSDRPAPVESLLELLQCTESDLKSAIQLLGSRLEQAGPLQLVFLAGGYQISTKPMYAQLVTRWLKPQKHRLSRSVMEVLAIVAYRQPITGPEIEQIRGVQSDYGLRQLLERRLVREVGRKPIPGRPILYGTTQQFLHQFNLKDLQDLPDLILSLPSGAEAEGLPEPRADIPLPGLDA